jgi:hypothetical protein
MGPMLVSSSTPHGVIFFYSSLSWVLKIDSSPARVVWIFSPFQLTVIYYCFTVDQLLLVFFAALIRCEDFGIVVVIIPSEQFYAMAGLTMLNCTTLKF